MNQHERKRRKRTHVNDIQVTVERKPPDTPASEALENGNAVGVDFPVNREETLEQKIQRLNKNLPYITQVDLNDDTLLISASKLISQIKFMIIVYK